ncbi:hypothetical protein [Caldalkalibacillus mannanilyticus]|uniref:hypothetical protein n=1 Tax=Caldalkalibacillus mannanilyticus TaxID=1418 RepID=UPI00046861FD|nr:hypothetical protein [Caldalkalibacillus mannanilyticus]
MDLLTGLFAGMFVLAIILVIVGIALYLLYSYSLFTLASNRGIDLAWLAFIPIAQLYILGKLIIHFRFNGKVYNQAPAEWVLVGVSILTAFTSGGLNSLLSLIGFLLFILASYNVYCIYKRESAGIYTVLTIIPFIAPFLYFAIRDNEADLSELDQANSVENTEENSNDINMS